jgi:hypothetical protein
MKFSVDFRPDKFRSKDLWCEAQNKLSEALEDRTQTEEIKYEKWTKHAPLSLFAIDTNPRLRLLAVSLQKLEDKARFTSIIYCLHLALYISFFLINLECFQCSYIVLWILSSFSNYITVVAPSCDFSCSETSHLHFSAMFKQ